MRANRPRFYSSPIHHKADSHNITLKYEYAEHTLRLLLSPTTAACNESGGLVDRDHVRSKAARNIGLRLVCTTSCERNKRDNRKILHSRTGHHRLLHPSGATRALNSKLLTISTAYYAAATKSRGNATTTAPTSQHSFFHTKWLISYSRMIRVRY